MNRMRIFLIAVSRRWWAVALVFALNFGAFGILFGLEEQFAALTGVPVYDTQNDLTPARLLEQLPLYSGAARAAYLRFAAFDFVFPLVAGLFVATLWTLLLRLNTGQLARRLLAWGLPLFVFIGTGWDWLENISLLITLNAGAAPEAWMLDAVILFKRLKLTWLLLNIPISSVLLGLLLVNIVQRVRQARATRAAPRMQADRTPAA